MLRQLKKCVAATIAILMVITMLPGGLSRVNASGSQTTINISDGSIIIGNGTASQNGNSLTYNSNGYIITGSGTTSNTVSITGGTQSITLSGVTISTETSAAFSISSGAVVHLTLSGSNSLTSGSVYAGLQVPKGAEVFISGSENDSLTAVGGHVDGGSGAGIGSQKNTDSGIIHISGGSITARSRFWCAAIGGGYRGNCGPVYISGGSVSAVADHSDDAGIGGGANANGGEVYISGGTVNAIGGEEAAGIGGGSADYTGNTGNGGKVFISGGTVYATGGTTGIGAGAYYGTIRDGGTVSITGGSVNSIIQNRPTNGSSSVFLTTVTIPAGKNVSGLTVKQDGSTYTYGSNGMQTDGSPYGKLYLWLPANTGNAETTADVTTDGSSYAGYHGTIETSDTSNLKMNQILTGLKSSYTYGDIISASVTRSGSAYSATLDYKSTDDSTDYGASKPTNVGNYSLTAACDGDDAYWPLNKTQQFSINPKGLTEWGVIERESIMPCIGLPLTPVVVKDGDTVLILGTDYTVTDKNTGATTFTDVGDYSLEIRGIGNYTGTVSRYFTIETPPGVNVDGNPTDWLTQAVLTITLDIGSSGLKSLEVYDGQAITDITSAYSGGYPVSHNGTYTFTVTDNANYSSSLSVPVNYIDADSPTISVSGNPESPVKSANVTISLTSGISGVRSLTVSGPQGDEDITYTFGNGYHIMENGTYTFTVTSGAGKTASKSITVSNIDVLPALRVEAMAGTHSYQSGTWTAEKSVDFALSNHAQNPGTVTYQYSKDSGNTWIDLSGTDYSVSSEGTTNLLFRILTATGYHSNVVSYIVNIDTAVPTEMKIDYSANPIKTILHFLTFHYFFGDTVTANFSANDSGIGLDHYEFQKVDSGMTFNENGQWTIGSSLNLSPGYAGTIYARAVDKLGHMSGIVCSSLVVDQTTPVISANNGSEALNSTDKNAAIPVSVTDTGSGVSKVTYQVNNTTYSVDLTDASYDDISDTYSFSIDNLPDGTYDVIVNAQDNSGNGAQTVTVHVTRNTQPTVTNITVNPGIVSLNHGDKQQFTATVTGTNLTAVTSSVKWSVSGNSDSGTSIDGNGTLTVDLDEASASLIVTATSINNGMVIGQATININISAQTGFGFSGGSICRKITDTAFMVEASGGQGRGDVSYTLTGGDGVVSLEGQKVIPLKAGKAVITATKAAQGSFREATATLDVNIGKGTSVISTVPIASGINVVGKLSSCELSRGGANVPGTFAWTNPDTVVTRSGLYEATFTPDDTANYNSCYCMVKVPVCPVINNGLSGIAFDLTGVMLPDGVTSASVDSYIEQKTNRKSAYTIIENQIGSGKMISGLTVYHLELLDQNNNPIKKFVGKITVRIPIPYGMSGDLHVYWYNVTDGTVTDMNARQENGYVVFETTHFSNYVVAELTAKVFPGSGTIPNPSTGSDPLQPLPVALLGILGLGSTVAIRSKRFRKKN